MTALSFKHRELSNNEAISVTDQEILGQRMLNVQMI